MSFDTGVKALTTPVNAYNGGYMAARPLVTDLNAVYGAPYKGVMDFGLLAPSVSSFGAFALINCVNEKLAVDNPIAVKALESKNSYFQKEVDEPCYVHTPLE
ncbi:hypothetical protein BDZ45DRAFT_751160 [Acephala macrosclerotiorum]|nr:hypothetical protein BDZ45DRAFT_751160 [Acephala macrosclerotiorum]